MVKIVPTPKYMINYNCIENKTFFDVVYFNILMQVDTNIDFIRIDINRMLSLIDSKKEFLEDKKQYFIKEANKYDSFYGASLMKDDKILRQSIEELIRSNIESCCSAFKCVPYMEYKDKHIGMQFDGFLVMKKEQMVLIQDTHKMIHSEPFRGYCNYLTNIHMIKELGNMLKKLKDKNSNKVTGFKTTLTEHQITNLYNASKEYIKTEKQNLINALTEQECKPIVWLINNKSKLRAFINAIFEPKAPQTISKTYFRDVNNNIIKLNKPVNKDLNYQNHIEEFRKMLK